MFLVRVMTVDNRKNDPLELVLKFRFQQFMKQFSNLFRRIFECAAAECPQNQTLNLVLQCNIENRAHLILNALHMLAANHAVFI